MALVAYDVSDCSDSEKEEDEGGTQAVVSDTTKLPPLNGEPVQSVSDPVTEEDDPKLFAVLPTPKSRPLLLGSDLNKLLMNPRSIGSKKSVKISVPALPELDDEDLPRPTTKKINPSKGSKLFDILPPPKNTPGGVAAAKKLVPDSLRKPVAPKPPPKPAPLVPRVVSAPLVSVETHDDSDEDTDTSDFLGLNRKDDVVSYETPKIPLEIPTIDVPEIPEPMVVEEPVVNHQAPADFVPFSNDDLVLDDEAMQRLCGGNKRRRNEIPAQLIDLSDSDVRPDQNEWMVKQLTEQKVMKSHSHKKNAGPSSQQKRKHQITYLAFQAKEQEQELQNQWANNKMTKKQTQSKYGF